jgi:hypothetical protein
MRFPSLRNAIVSTLIVLVWTAMPTPAATADSVVIPEPASMGVLFSGVIGLLLATRLKR